MTVTTTICPVFRLKALQRDFHFLLSTPTSNPLAKMYCDPSRLHLYPTAVLLVSLVIPKELESQLLAMTHTAIWGLGFWTFLSPALPHSERCSASSFCCMDAPRLPLPQRLARFSPLGILLPGSWLCCLPLLVFSSPSRTPRVCRNTRPARHCPSCALAHSPAQPLTPLESSASLAHARTVSSSSAGRKLGGLFSIPASVLSNKVPGMQ